MTIALLGVPWDAGNGVARGSGEAAARLRRYLPDGLFCDHGDVARIDGEDAQSFFTRMAAAIPDGPTFILGGDHSISYTAIEKAQRAAPLHIVWIDAHTDFSHVEGDGWHDHKQVLRRVAGLPNVAGICHYGYRGFTIGDERRMHPKLTVVPASRQAPDLLGPIGAGSRCYVSIDVDAIDPRWAPGTATPVPGGLSVDDVLAALRPVLRSCAVAGIDFVEYSPAHDIGDVTGRLSAELVAELASLWEAALGGRRTQLPAAIGAEVRAIATG